MVKQYTIGILVPITALIFLLSGKKITKCQFLPLVFCLDHCCYLKDTWKNYLNINHCLFVCDWSFIQTSVQEALSYLGKFPTLWRVILTPETPWIKTLISDILPWRGTTDISWNWWLTTHFIIPLTRISDL